LKTIFSFLLILFTCTICLAQSYYYDASNRLVQVSSNCSGTLYTYDANGNRLSISQISIITTSSVIDEHCGNDGQITITPQNPSTTYRYQWSSGQTTASIKNLAAGPYSVVITEPLSGFTCNQSFTINPVFKDSLQVNPKLTTCVGGSDGKAKIKVITPNPKGTYTYHWSTNSDTTYTVTDSVSNLRPGSYSVNVRNSFTGCVKTINYSISEPQPFLTSITQTAPKCHNGNDGTAKAEVTGNISQYTFSWSGGTIGIKTSQQVTGLAAGTYTAVVTQIATQCTATQTVTITDKPPLFSISKTDITCFKGNNGTATVQLASGASSDYSFAWTGPINGTLRTFRITSLPAGVYHVLVTENTGNRCADTASVIINEPADNIQSIDANPGICYGQNDGSAEVKVTGSANQYTYQWYYQTGGYTLNQITNTAINLKPGVYAVTVTAQNGCTSTRSFTIKQSTFTGSIILYPNPTKGKFTIAICNIVSRSAEYYVYTIAGQLLLKNTTSAINGIMQLDISQLPPGTYSVVVVLSGQKSSPFAVIKL
jgi:YD repeat-containing protein